MSNKNPDSGSLILETIARRAGVTAGILFESRTKEITAWRMIAIYLLRKSGRTLAQIAATVSRDASTISHAYAKIDKLANKKWFIELSNSIEDELDKLASKQIRKQILNAYCQRIPMGVYAAAFASSDD
jgi:chromosomal replication initiation ATPase DnaA